MQIFVKVPGFNILKISKRMIHSCYSSYQTWQHSSMQWVVLMSRPVDKATDPLPYQYLFKHTLRSCLLTAVFCFRLQLLTNSAKVGLYTDRSTSSTVVCTVQDYLRTPTILFGTGYILRRVYIIFRLSLIFCYFLLSLISFYTPVSRVSFHLFIRCLLLSFWHCNA